MNQMLKALLLEAYWRRRLVPDSLYQDKINAPTLHPLLYWLVNAVIFKEKLSGTLLPNTPVTKNILTKYKDQRLIYITSLQYVII